MQQVIQGQIVQIEPRQNGWVAVHVAIPGKQYPTKVSTKDQVLLGAAQQMFGQFVDALFDEWESNSINPHTGKPYINRTLEQIAPAGSGQIQQPPPQPVMQQQAPVAVPTTMMQPQVQPQQQFGNLQPQLPPQPVQYQPPPPPVVRHEVTTDHDRENRIMRQAATKVASNFLPMLAEEDRNLRSLIRISEQLLRYYREGVAWETAPVSLPQTQEQQMMAMPGQQAGYENPAEYENTPPPPTDDDVPF